MNEIIPAMAAWLQAPAVPSHEEIIKQFGNEFLMYRRAWGRNVKTSHDKELDLYRQRDEAIKRFGFSIPSGELLDALRRLQPIVEIGAGSGYLTALMRKHGIDVIGTDPRLAYEHVISHGAHDTKQLTIEGKTAVRRFADRTVFCSWPSLSHTWFRQALKAMRIGRRIIIIEEDSCGDNSTWDYRDANFRHESEIALPAWPYMNDRANVWVKQRRRGS